MMLEKKSCDLKSNNYKFGATYDSSSSSPSFSCNMKYFFQKKDNFLVNNNKFMNDEMSEPMAYEAIFFDSGKQRNY